MLRRSFRLDRRGYDDEVRIDSYYPSDSHDGGDSAIVVRIVPADERSMCEKGDVLRVENAGRYADGVAAMRTVEAPVVDTDDDGSFFIRVPKYMVLKIGEAEIVAYGGADDPGEVPRGALRMYFPEGHFFDEDDDGAISLHIDYGDSSGLTFSPDGMRYVDARTLEWDIPADGGGSAFEAFCAVVFPSGTDYYSKGSGFFADRLSVMRDDVLFYGPYTADRGFCTKIRRSVDIGAVDIPFARAFDKGLHTESEILGMFYDEEKDRSKNGFVDMEKCCFSPVERREDGAFGTVERIVFSMNFLDPDGSGWNFERRNSATPVSDLLGELGFSDKDVRTRSRALRESCLRIAYYDSDNEGSQNLIGYSVAYMDADRMYDRFNRGQGGAAGIYHDIRIDDGRVLSMSVGAYKEYIPAAGEGVDAIEGRRLGARIEVGNRASSGVGREGFCMYMFYDGGVMDVYAKFDFYNAKANAMVPLMVPYVVNPRSAAERRLKSQADIAGDWDGGGYGTRLVGKYSYLRLKSCYDAVGGRYVYYLDPEVYGFGTGSDTIELGLYEARMSL